MADEPRFQAFLSYANKPDYGLARELEAFLESFHQLDSEGELNLSELAICRDGSDFRPSGTPTRADSVAGQIVAQLERSEYLVVLASPSSASSRHVDSEVGWFLANRGANRILVAVTWGDRPALKPEQVFSPRMLAAGLHEKPWYDLRGRRWMRALRWHKVRDFDEARTQLAAHLLGETAGRIYPLWARQRRRAARRRLALATAVVAVLALLAAYATWQRSLAVDRADAIASNLAEYLDARAHAAAEEDARHDRALVLACRAFEVEPASSARAEVYATRALDLIRRLPELVVHLEAEPQHTRFSPRSDLVLATLRDRTVAAWSLPSGEPLAVPTGNDGAPLTSHVAPVASRDSTRLAAVHQPFEWDETGRPAEVVVWRAGDGEVLMRASVDLSPGFDAFHLLRPARVDFSGDGATVCVTMEQPGDRPGHRFVLFAWNVADGRALSPERVLGTNDGVAFRLNPAAGRDWAIVSTARTTEYVVESWPDAERYEARVLDLHTGRPPPGAAPLVLPGALLFADFSADGERVVTMSRGSPGHNAQDSSLAVWEAATGQLLWRSYVDTFEAQVLAVGRDATHVVVASRDGAVRLWTAADAGQPVRFEGVRSSATEAWIVGDSNRVIRANARGTVLVHENGLNWRSLKPFHLAEDRVAARLSPDGRSLLTVRRAGVLEVFPLQDIPTATATQAIPARAEPFEAVELSPDGTRILAQELVSDDGRDRTTRLWLSDAETGSPLWDEGFPVTAGHAAFDPTGRWVLARTRRASSGVHLQAWRAADGEPLWDAPVPLGVSIQDWALTPDGGRLAAATATSLNQGEWQVLSWQVDEHGLGQPETVARFDDRRHAWLGFDGSGSAFAVSQDGQYVHSTRRVQLRSTSSGAPLGPSFRFDDPTLARLLLTAVSSSRSLAATPDQVTFELGAGARWTAATGPLRFFAPDDGRTLLRSLDAAGGPRTPYRISDDGRWFTASRVGGGAALYDASTGRAVVADLPMQAASARLAGAQLVGVDAGGALMRLPTGRVPRDELAWLGRAGTALTGLRLVGDRELERVARAEHARLRAALFSELETRAEAGDTLAGWVLARPWLGP